MRCTASGCSATVETELKDHQLCLEHYLAEVSDRTHDYARKLENQSATHKLEEEVMHFVVLSAAKIATIGTQNPPDDQRLRGKLLNAMLVLADLRDRLDKALQGRKS